MFIAFQPRLKFGETPILLPSLVGDLESFITNDMLDAQTKKLKQQYE